MDCTPTLTICLDRAVQTNPWGGAPLTLQQYNAATMTNTPNGSLVLAYWNQAKQNNAGQLTLSSGGSPPTTYCLAWGLQQPTILVQNWQGNQLQITNTSQSPNTPILIEAYGPGLPPDKQPAQLPTGSPLSLHPLDTAQGSTAASSMELVFKYATTQLGIFAFIGGQPDAAGNNAYVLALNSPAGNTGDGTSAPAASGYFATRQGNQYQYQFDWGQADLYVVFFGSATIVTPQTARAPSLPPATVTLLSL